MAEWCADNLRDVEGWRACGLHVSTTSNEACKEFDGLLRQLVSWSDCQQLGGLVATAKRMIDADPTAVICRALSYGMDALSTETSARVNPDLREKLDTLEKDASVHGTDWEKLHVKAVKQWAYGYFRAATETWEEILREHPTDLMAVKFAHDAYFFMGDCNNIRDSVKRVLPHWRKDSPCHSYLHGMLAFGLEECGELREAEKTANVALSLNRFDCWATHAQTHVMEMEGRHEEGIQFLESTVDNWRPGWMLATHNYWHNALFYTEKGEYETALSIFDIEISERTNKNGGMLDIVDASSMLLRLEMEGVDVGSRWQTLPNIASHLDDHVTAFNDVHFAAMLNRKGDEQNEGKLHESLIDFTRSGCNDNSRICGAVGLPLYEGIIDYCNEKYDDAAEKMLPIRNQIYNIGGSHAQRDIFNQALIHACSKSEKEEHWKAAPQLLEERASMRSGHSPLAERLVEQFRKRHPL